MSFDFYGNVLFATGQGKEKSPGNDKSTQWVATNCEQLNYCIWCCFKGRTWEGCGEMSEKFLSCGQNHLHRLKRQLQVRHPGKKCSLYVLFDLFITQRFLLHGSANPFVSWKHTLRIYIYLWYKRIWYIVCSNKCTLPRHGKSFSFKMCQKL